jgi:hypothetical protein
LREHGVYRNIVAARDGTILAGHGVYAAAKKLGLKSVPVIRLNVAPGDPQALKIMVGDNEIEHLAEQNDRLLGDLLKEIREDNPDQLLGTGFDDMMLANFAMVTRGRDELSDFDAAAEWVGMPEFSTGGKVISLMVGFKDEKSREDFAARSGLVAIRKGNTGRVWSAMWPPEERDDTISLRVETKSR